MELSSEPPFEALVFNYLSLGFSATINSFLTWVAVLTAAVSFWRLRSTTSGSNYFCRPHESEPHVSFHERIADGSRETSEQLLTPSAQCDEEEEEDVKFVNAVAVSSVSAAVGDDGNVKGKFFTAYYPTDGEVDEAEDELTETEKWGDGVWLFDDWEKRTRDLGWYSYQDLTVFNGDVVRLWDGVNSPSRRVRW